MNAALWCCIGFLGGVAVGAMWREAFELALGRDDPMQLRQRIRDAHVSILTLGLIISMLFTGLVGVALLVSNNARGDLVRCVSDYNRQTGDARDSRTAIADTVATAQLEYVQQDLTYQRGLLRVLTTSAALEDLTQVVRERITASEAYLKQLEDQETVRAASPYPAPDLCENPDDQENAR